MVLELEKKKSSSVVGSHSHEPSEAKEQSEKYPTFLLEINK